MFNLWLQLRTHNLQLIFSVHRLSGRDPVQAHHGMTEEGAEMMSLFSNDQRVLVLKHTADLRARSRAVSLNRCPKQKHIGAGFSGQALRDDRMRRFEGRHYGMTLNRTPQTGPLNRCASGQALRDDRRDAHQVSLKGWPPSKLRGFLLQFPLRSKTRYWF